MRVHVPAWMAPIARDLRINSKPKQKPRGSPCSARFFDGGDHGVFKSSEICAVRFRAEATRHATRPPVSMERGDDDLRVVAHPEPDAFACRLMKADDIGANQDCVIDSEGAHGQRIVRAARLPCAGGETRHRESRRRRNVDPGGADAHVLNEPLPGEKCRQHLQRRGARRPAKLDEVRHSSDADVGALCADDPRWIGGGKA